MSTLEEQIAKKALPVSVLQSPTLPLNGSEIVTEKWAELLGFLKNQGFEAEVMTKINIKPTITPQKDEVFQNKLVVKNILLKKKCCDI